MDSSQYTQIKQAAFKEREDMLFHQSQQINKLAQEHKIDLHSAFSIANLTIPQIVQKLNQHILTSQHLLTALSLRVIKIARQFNLFTYLYFRKGLESARKCDQERRKTGKKNITIRDMANIKDASQYDNFFPPLFGIPISIKDVYHLEGRFATHGIPTFINKPHQESALIYCLRNSGLIPFVQTNVPQMGMAIETNNFLWGRSVNPWNKERSVAGSSGGQGGMISARCSLLGIGSDVGGSIRIPAEHNGVFGFKGNSRRISNQYHAAYCKEYYSFGQNMCNTIGPLAKSAEDLALFMSVVTNQKFYKGQQDAYTKIIPFDSRAYLDAKQSGKKLKIGYFTSLKDLQPTTASQRAMNEVLQILKKDGHQLVEIQVPNQREILKSFIDQFLSCEGRKFQKTLAGQKIIKQIEGCLVRGADKLEAQAKLKQQSPRTHFYMYSKDSESPIMRYQQHMGQIHIFRAEWIKYWRSKQLDLSICPGFGCQAFPHEMSAKTILPAIYTFIWNVLDMGVGAMPITLVRQDEQEYKSKFADSQTQDLKLIAKGSVGLPVGIQIVGLPYHEEKVLGFMSYLQEKVQFYSRYGAPKIQPQ